MGTKVWLDSHLFNKTLKTNRKEDGSKVWLMDEAKAKEGGLEWPVNTWPTLCFLGLGQSSIEYLVTLAQFFPELQLVLMDVQDASWLEVLTETLKESVSRVSLGNTEEFAEARGPYRRSCQAISWSVDTPPFSFYRYRELFYSVPYVLALFNMQGCTVETRKERTAPKDKYYCEYLYSAFQATLCGKVTENKSAGKYQGQELFFPMVDTGCGENICMCHAHSDAFVDFHFEHLCRKGDPEHHFMGQWGQDEFMLNNIFRLDHKQGQGTYVDVGASHPYHLSNTAYFDLCLGWRGVCMEPNPRSDSILKALRTCEVVSACAWSASKTLRFSNGGELSGITDDETLQTSEPYEMNQSAIGNTYFEARCAPLHDLLLEALPIGSTIDLMSVDAEGAEIDIFKDFPFQVWNIRAIVVEVSRRTAMAIDSLLLPRGFLKVAVLGKDAVYVVRALANALPPEGPKLPDRIQWNEPGTDEDSIEYIRFQRYFGVDGDLDEDVGDQRLENETEMERQSNRTEAQHNASLAELIRQAEGAAVGGVLSEREQKALELEWVQDVIRDGQVKAALDLLAADPQAFRREVRASHRLQSKISELVTVGALENPIAAAMAKEFDAGEKG